MSISLVGPSPAEFSRKPVYTLDLGLYPDNTPVINYAEAWKNTGGHFDAMMLKPASIQEFFTGMMICESIKERGGRVKNLIIPCIPGARQDRIKWEGDMLFTLKYVAKAINAQGFDSVFSVDPHSMATAAMIDKFSVVDQQQVYWLLGRAYGFKWDGVIAPDRGAIGRAEAFQRTFARDHEMTVHYGVKHRDPETNKLSGFSVDGLETGKHYIVVDDLCDGGGTFLGLAEKIKEAGATADLFVTHGLFTKNASEKLARVFSRVYSTDSWPIATEHVSYIKITEGMI